MSVIQLIRQNFANHLEVEISVLYLHQYKPFSQTEFHFRQKQHYFGQITFIPMFLWRLGNGERLPFPW